MSKRTSGTDTRSEDAAGAGKRVPAQASEALIYAVFAFLNARTLRERRLLYQRNAELFETGDLEGLLAEIGDTFREPRQVELLRAASRQLELCRQGHLEAAFADAEDPRPVDPASQGYARIAQELDTLRDPTDGPRRVELCRQALALADRQKQPLEWARWNGQLATCLAQNPLGSPADNLEEAIAHYRLALEVFTPEDDADMWIRTQISLGAAYNDRVRGARSENLETARRTLEEVRPRLAPEDETGFWARASSNLGIVYLERLRGERAENVEKAVVYLEEALVDLDPVKRREEWAMIHHNLGLAYDGRVRGEPEDNLEQSIEHHEHALKANSGAGAHRRPVIEAQLAQLYSDRRQGKPRENLLRALRHAQSALKRLDVRHQPQDWAMAQSVLGSVHRRLGTAASRARAITAFEHALKVYKPGEWPREWATVQGNLANLYAGEDRSRWTASSEEAARRYRAALEIFTLARSPFQHCDLQRKLGDLCSLAGHDQPALEAYQGAIDASEALLASAVSEGGRRIEAAATSDVYFAAADCRLRLGQPHRAFETLERGKARLLVDALRLADAELAEVDQALVAEFRAARTSARNLQAELAVEPHRTPPSTRARALADQLEAGNVRLARAIAEIRRQRPGFLSTAPDVAGSLSRIPPDAAVVAPLVARRGGAVFLIPSGLQTLGPEHVLRTDTFDQASVGNLTAAWSGAYTALRQQGTVEAYQQFETTLERVTGQLGDLLLGEIAERLRGWGVKHLIFAPHGGLQLLPLHAAWRQEAGNRSYLSDSFRVSYIPSLFVLERLARRTTEGFGGGAALVAGVGEYQSLPPLASTPREAKAIAELFGVEPVLDEQATPERIHQAAFRASHLHLACHGSFAWGDDPLASSLYLANDAPLLLSDVVFGPALEGHPLVTLSACETGLVESERSPDEFVGWSTGFLQAGASAVLSSLWAVDDHSTMFLLLRFYALHLGSGLPAAEALRQAQIWLREATEESLLAWKQPAETPLENAPAAAENRPYAHPIHWAAFTMNGG